MEKFYGRRVLLNEQQDGIITCQAIQDGQCQRCHQKIKDEWTLPDGASYCWHCHQLGRISSNQFLGSLPEPHQFNVEQDNICSWAGELTQAQKQVADEMLETWKQHGNHLIYAVTGAGKTEMLYPLLTEAFKAKKRVAIVSPRVDVVIELGKRIPGNFNVEQVVLYGDSPDSYRYMQLVIATTHQLFHFWQAFDLIIVDEIDAFPYAENPLLAHVVQEALIEQGSVVYLTATPSRRLLKEVRTKKMQMSILARRFHGHPLPEIKILRCQNWRKKLPAHLFEIIEKYQESGQRFLIFVPHVDDLEYVYQKIQDKVVVATVHAAASDRAENVQKMRDEEVQGLITTTILERGVTFPKIDVLILGASDQTFSQAALIQMAGRCGRSNKRPDGLVLAIVDEKSQTVLRAKAEIEYLNRLGGTKCASVAE
jgi:competence protein ComFA